MIKSVPKENNRANLIYVADKLKEIDYFVFFGTLLGLERVGDIISHDDDVDFFVNINDRDCLINILKDSELTFNWGLSRNNTPYFLQGYRMFGEEKTFVDFYFYETNEVDSFIRQRWNFSGLWKRKYNNMHIPKNIIFPIQQKQYFDQSINMPARPSACCEYLYGPTWEIPLLKKVQYKILMLNNKPMILIGFWKFWIFWFVKLYRKLFKFL